MNGWLSNDFSARHQRVDQPLQVATKLFKVAGEVLRLIARMLTHYLRNLTRGRLILWCYFIWYLVVLIRYFDASLRLWLTSLGLSVIIGFALFISTTAASDNKVKLDRWQTFRLFLMPFCVSSFAALVKGKGFILIFSPNPFEIGLAVALCALLCAAVALLKQGGNSSRSGN